MARSAAAAFRPRVDCGSIVSADEPSDRKDRERKKDFQEAKQYAHVIYSLLRHLLGHLLGHLIGVILIVCFQLERRLELLEAPSQRQVEVHAVLQTQPPCRQQVGLGLNR